MSWGMADKSKCAGWRVNMKNKIVVTKEQLERIESMMELYMMMAESKLSGTVAAKGFENLDGLWLDMFSIVE